jgi:hypothetical protein
MKVTNLSAANAINAKSHRKEDWAYTQYTLLDLSGESVYCSVTLRIYFKSSSNMVYACFWFNLNGETYGSGSGRAGGYGYHKGSAAAAEAFRAAGFTFDEHISGRGDSAITDALEAIANHAGITKYYIHKANN